MAVCSFASQRQASCIASSSGRCRHNAPLPRRWAKARFVTRANNVDTGSDAPAPGLDLDNPDSEASRKKAEADRLRAAEKFMVIGSGEAACKGCGYEYKPERGDPDFPVAKGTLFQATPEDYYCPVCGASKDQFEARVKVVAGFAENQQYGLGTNSMTSSQKQLIIYGALLLFFALFLGGYALE